MFDGDSVGDEFAGGQVVSDAVKLQFRKQDIEIIRLCLSCPLPDCAIIACPYLIPDEAKAHARYREKDRKRRQERYQKQKQEREQKRKQGEKE